MFDSLSNSSNSDIDIDLDDYLYNTCNYNNNNNDNNNDNNDNNQNISNVIGNMTDSPLPRAAKHKIGLSVASVNARGLVANPDHRIALGGWMVAHNTDIMCVQEYYVPHEHNKVEFDMSNFKNYSLVQSENNSRH